jgi:hypothetical protein
MPSKPKVSALAAAFLLVSGAISVALLAARNLYDDEIFSLDVVTRPVREIVRLTAEGDVHPPGMYVLAHIAWCATGSFRWLNVFPGLVLYAGLAVFLLQVAPLFARVRAQVCLLLLATLHPQLLMWGATYRWYGWWTGIALIALTVALQPRETRPVLSTARAVCVGTLLAALFYLNYIALLFALALGGAMVVRYFGRPRRELMRRAAVIAAVFLALIAPQLHTMMAAVHSPEAGEQRSGVALSMLRLLQALAASEAYLPWHPLAIAADAVFAGLCVCGAMMLLRRRGQSTGDANADTSAASGGLASIAVFGAVFFVLVAASGLGGKPRNGLLLVPVMAVVAAMVVDMLRPRAQDAVLAFLAVWSVVGIAHMLGRYGMTKATMNDRPEQVVGFVAQPSGRGCAVVVTYDSGLAFALAQARLPGVLVVSPFRGWVFGGASGLPAGCVRPHLYVVKSYLGEDEIAVRTMDAELESAMQSMDGAVQVDHFSADPDAARKRRLASLAGGHGAGWGGELGNAARLPDYRYVVRSGAMEVAGYEAMRRRMPHFKSGYAVSVDDEPSHAQQWVK